MFRKPSMGSCFHNYIELLVLKVLQSHKDSSKEAYDNEESSVRKSAVFCMVALHASVGEEALQPHLAALNGSKLKLLHLYIRRAQQGSSVPTSPKNAPP
ncbi:CLIP-associating protein 2 [Blattella germanica]|nr:CLIP-associating protein 2 [Blattella germanica]